MPKLHQKGIRNRQRGVALIAVVVSMAILGVIVVELTTNTNIDRYSAEHAELDMKAHFLAKSGMNLAELLINVQGRIDNGVNKQFSMDVQIGDFVDQFIGAFGGSKEEKEAWAELIGGLAADDIRGLGVPEGTFSLQMTTEDAKINLNCANGSADEKKYLYVQLFNLLYLEAYNPVFENEDAEGWRRDRETQIKSIIDYVDKDRYNYVFEEGLSARIREDYGYETLEDKYKPKNNYLDTTDEIKLARGVDDRLWTLFGSAFTVYGDCKINLAAIDDIKLIASLIAYAAKNANDPVVADQTRLWALAQAVKEAKEFGFAFNSADAFIDFVKDPSAGLTGYIDQQAAQGLPTSPQGQNTGPPIEGVELDKTKLNQVTKTAASGDLSGRGHGSHRGLRAQYFAGKTHCRRVGYAPAQTEEPSLRRTKNRQQ